ncbi:hypothetical protein [Algibacter lectus]|uniref:DUF4595 domain-containing protein n=1 Tax=Algibacter lectus TaxID=221126 RepID=A0A4R8MGV9_9FLAO|nr:hypothetical protein [Algibacter lectus]MWW26899.1 hypothetical protein [Algibacter lectus]TDY65269.1 hypothetical protein DFQ06_0195 [Algibacter lectus]
MKKHYSLFALTFLLIISCSKSDNPSLENRQELFLSKIESVVKNNTLEITDTFNFVYDEDNYLIRYDYQASNMFNYSKTLTYSNGQLATLDDFTISIDNDLITLTSDNSKQEYYVENNKIIQYKWYHFEQSSSSYFLYVTTNLTFDNNFQNVIKTEHFNSKGELIQYSNFEYDDKNNPFSNFINIFNLSVNIIGTAFNSKNNITRVEVFELSGFGGFGIPSIGTYSYTYNNSNYPKSLDYNFNGFNAKSNYIYK